MRLTPRLMSFALVSATAAFSLPVAAQHTPATLPASFEGTYELTYQSYNNASPFDSGMEVTFVLAPGGLLCIEEMGLNLSDPFLSNGNIHEANWETDDNLLIGLSDIAGSFNEVNIAESDGNGNFAVFYGQLSGSKVSEATDCSLSSPGEPGLTVSALEQNVFDLAEQLFPDIFSNGSELRSDLGYLYRYYADSGVYVGLKDGTVNLLGGPFGSEIVSQGSLDDVLIVLEGLKADRQPDDTAAAITALEQEMFDMAEQLLPELFSNGSEILEGDGYVYRYFGGSNVYVRLMEDGSISLLGGPFGDSPYEMGAVTEVVAILEDIEVDSGGVNVDIDVGGNPDAAGDYTLTISGTSTSTTTAGGISIPVTVPLEVTLQNIQAPNPQDLDAVESSLEESMEGLGDIKDLQISVVTNTANRITFDLTFSGTYFAPEGVSSELEYDLRYDYVK